jgi:hypothetical protein
MESSSGQRHQAHSEPTASANLRIRISPLIEIYGSTEFPGRDSRGFIRLLAFGSLTITPPVTILISISAGLPVWAPVVIIALQLLGSIIVTRHDHGAS